MSSMKGYTCWHPETARAVINPMAEHIPPGLFRAVHSDWPLRVDMPRGRSASDLDRDAMPINAPEAFLEGFLTRPEGSFAVILGETGSGKSHLVHWIGASISQRDNRHVIIVKKSRTNLRSILAQLIEALPEGPEREEFEDRLRRAASAHTTRDAQRRQLLFDLAEVIREQELPDDIHPAERKLRETLPDLFGDPEIRGKHYGEKSIIAILADHVFGASGLGTEQDVRQEFTAKDFPEMGRILNDASAQGRAAIAAIEELQDHDLPVDLHVKIVNKALEQAIPRSLNFSGDQVEELMVALREYLHREGKELVLLIEEFVKMQGIDRALLNVLTTQGGAGQGGQPQCVLRSAIAVTTGFLSNMPETAYARASHIVDMDHTSGQGGENRVTPETVAAFAAPYLNAVRMGGDEVEAWGVGAEIGERAPSHCDACPHREPCHSGFGAQEGYGLYPFTPQALYTMAARVMSEMPDVFVPRELLGKVLKIILGDHHDDIAGGTYPGRQILRDIPGRNQLDPAEQGTLRSADRESSPRWISAIELYGDGRTIRNLPETVHEAFALPAMPGGQTAPAPEQSEKKPVEKDTPTPPSEPAQSREDQRLTRWVNDNADLDKETVKRLRDQLHSVIVNRVDWNGLGLLQSSFTDTFKQHHIKFEGHSEGRAGQFSLVIGRDADTAQALQGLLKAEKGNWNFPGGTQALGKLLDCLERWQADLVAQFRIWARPSAEWCQATAAVELLTLDAALSGALVSQPTVVQTVKGAFSGKRSESEAFTDEVRDLRRLLATGTTKTTGRLDMRADLTKTAQALLGATKGNSAAKILDGGRLRRIVRALRDRGWTLNQTPPENNKTHIARVYSTAAPLLAPALETEAKARRTWLDAFETRFGTDTEPKQIIEEAKVLAEEVGADGLLVGQTRSKLVAAGEAVRPQPQKALLEAMRAARAIDVPAQDPPCLGRSDAAHARAMDALSEAISACLDAVDDALEQAKRRDSTEMQKIRDSRQKIDAALATLDDDLAALSHVPEAANDAA